MWILNCVPLFLNYFYNYYYSFPPVLFTQMLMVSSTEPCTLANCDPPQVQKPPKDYLAGRTVPLRPVPRAPFPGRCFCGCCSIFFVIFPPIFETTGGPSLKLLSV